MPVTGEVFDEIQVDGFNLRTGWCLLVASSRGRPVAFQWAGSENTAAWSALLQQVPKPVVVISDGGSGLASALAEHWPNAKHQRGLVHLQRNVRRYTTMNSKTAAGRALWGLARKLTRVHSLDDMTAWLQLLAQWETEFLHLTKKRTYAKDATIRPAWVKPNQTWWFTHLRLRQGHQVLARRIRANDMFTFLDPDLAALHVSSTTNQIEGGINAPIRELLHRHRGLNEEHQRRALEWWLYLHHPAKRSALEALDNAVQAPTMGGDSAAAATTEDLDAPALYDTGMTADEGLWHRSGWAGRG